MKSIMLAKLLLGIILFTLVGFIKIPLKNDSVESKKCLKLNAMAIAEDVDVIDSLSFTLFEKNENMEWIEIINVSSHDCNCSFALDANKYYHLEVSKPGFVKRSIVISTILPSNISIKPIFEYWFEVKLFKEKKGVDDYYLDFPIALIGYNEHTEVFENNHSYTQRIKTKIKEVE